MSRNTFGDWLVFAVCVLVVWVSMWLIGWGLAARTEPSPPTPAVEVSE